MYAPAKPKYPIITPDILTTYDAFILGIPTRYGNMPAQWKVCSCAWTAWPAPTPTFTLGFLGLDWPALGWRKARRKICLILRFDSWTRWRSRVYSFSQSFNPRSPWNCLRSFRLQPRFPPIEQPRGSSRWWVIYVPKLLISSVNVMLLTVRISLGCGNICFSKRLTSTQRARVGNCSDSRENLLGNRFQSQILNNYNFYCR